MTTQGLTINEKVGIVLELETKRITLYVAGQPMSELTAVEMENFTNSYAQLQHRVMPLNETNVASMIQNLAGEGLLTLRAVGRTPSGFALRLGMKAGGPRWTVRNYGDWYRAHEEARLEAARRGLL